MTYARWSLSASGNFNPYVAKYADENGDYTKFDKNGLPDKTRTNTSGIWNVFYDGKLVGTVNKQSNITGEDLAVFKAIYQGIGILDQETKKDNTDVVPTQVNE